MRKNLSDLAFYPLPVLMLGTYDEHGTPNLMNAAWGGMCSARHVAVNISRRHKTTDNILLKRAFTLSFANEAHRIEADYVGLVSGKDENKIEKAGLHPVKSEFVDAPLFEEFPLTLECKVVEVSDSLGLVRVVGEVVNLSAHESILGEDGLPDADKLQPLCYDRAHKDYRALGPVVGKAYSDGKKLL